MKKLLMVLIVSSLVILTFAQGPGYQKTNTKNHPRVNQVNKRIDNQEKRINKEVKDGDLTNKQAIRDRKNLSEMNQEKKDMRKMDDGHLTKADQKALNQQLNQNSRKIGQ
jgi:fructose-1,6-bisphosphatase